MARNLFFHASNDLDRLTDFLGEVLDQPLSSPLRKETLVVQSQGMARWLSLKLARRRGICMNTAFVFPRHFIDQVLVSTGGIPPEALFHSRDLLTWRIATLLPGLLDQPEFTTIRQYLSDPDDALKRFQLAEKIASVFDQYIVYRPDFIRDWESGKRTDGWQGILWNRLIQAGGFGCLLAREIERMEFTNSPGLEGGASSREEGSRGVLSPPRMAVDGGDKAPPSNNQKLIAEEAQPPERVSIFGITTLPPLYLELLRRLAERIPVHLFLLQPTEVFWGDLLSEKETDYVIRRESKKLGRPVTRDELHLSRGNPLLTSLGRQGREFLNLVIEMDFHPAHESFQPVAEDSLLHAIQARVFKAVEDPQQPRPRRRFDAADRSIEFHSCHSRMREIEALHDRVLDWLNADPNRLPRDILVMAPDIEVYAPYINAVFGHPENEAQRLLFSIADRKPRSENPVTDLFFKVLELAGSRFTSRQVLSVLENPVIRARFDLNDDRLSTIRQWIVATRISWGIDAAHRAKEFGVPDLPEGTWRHGLDRLLLGTAMRGTDRGLFEGRLPYDEIEGSGDLQTLGRFCSALECLFDLHARLSEERSLRACPESGMGAARGHLGRGQGDEAGESPKRALTAESTLASAQMARAQGVAAAQGFGLRCGDPAKPAAGIVWSPRLAQKPCGAATAPIRLSGHALKDWPVVLTDLLNRLLPEAESFQAQARAVRRAIDALRQVAARQTCEAPVGRQVIVHHLSRIVEEGAWEGGYLTGGITFCSLKPMRSIPSKNICLIGMNEEDFPRHPYRLGFDLMAAERRPGDRSLRDDDRYLFLETLLSARDTLSISYVGQSIRDHSEFMPSVVVCELLDFLNSVSEFPEGGVRKHLVVRHRLQPFHSAYFSGKESLFSFSRANLVAARRLQEPADPPAPFVAGKVPSSPEEFRSLDIQDLIGFFRHPCRHFVEKRLDIRLGEDTDDIREEEGYALNRLESYVHRDELTERLLSGDVTKPAEWEIYNARAELPLGAAGRVLHGSIEEEAREFCRTVKHLEGDAPPQFPDVVVNLDGFTVSGRVGPVFGNRLLRYRCAKMKPRDLLAAWIQHLFLATSLPEMAIETLVAGTDKVQRLQSVSDPEALLRKLLRIYAQGLEIPLPFFPEVSFEYSRYSADTGGKKRTAPLDAARREWFPQPYSEMSPPCDDIYNHTCFGHRIPDPLDQEFEELAEAICGPLIEHMDKVDVQKEAS